MNRLATRLIRNVGLSTSKTGLSKYYPASLKPRPSCFFSSSCWTFPHAHQSSIQPRFITFYRTILRFQSSKIDIKDEIDYIVKNNKVVLFMKGVPEAPKCGFSNAVVQILRIHGVEYDSHDILEDETLRQGVKEFSNWPTIPQVYINGQFVGGCDVMVQLHQSGELIEEFEKAGIRSALLDDHKMEK